MYNLSEFLGVPEGVEFKTVNSSQVALSKSKFKILNNKLLIEEAGKNWCEANININELIMIDFKEIPQSILTDKEKLYLNNLIEPVRNEVSRFNKSEVLVDCEGKKVREHIVVYLNDTIFASYPFLKGTQFKGMEAYRNYTLKDLGLD